MLISVMFDPNEMQCHAGQHVDVWPHTRPNTISYGTEGHSMMEEHSQKHFAHTRLTEVAWCILRAHGSTQLFTRDTYACIHLHGERSVIIRTRSYQLLCLPIPSVRKAERWGFVCTHKTPAGLPFGSCDTFREEAKVRTRFRTSPPADGLAVQSGILWPSCR